MLLTWLFETCSGLLGLVGTPAPDVMDDGGDPLPPFPK